MELRQGAISLSATDLVGHHDCHHLTNLERAVALGSLERPQSWSPLAALLAERGDAHEKAFVEHLAGSGVEVVRVEGRGIEPEAVRRTLALMEAGTPAIVQGALRNGRWVGGPTSFGASTVRAGSATGPTKRSTPNFPG